jgi:inner membrane protein
MDNLSHTLTGLFLARTRLGSTSPLSLPLLVAAANLPDVDLLWSFGQDSYLLHHRGITHSFAGLAVQTGLLAAFAALLERRRAARRREPAPTNAARRLSILCAAGLASHLALDWLNVYGVRPWLPFDARWHYGDMAFIVDPWIWLLLAAGGFLAAASTRATSIALAVFGALGAALTLGSERAPPRTGAVWIAGFSTLAIAYVLGWGRGRPRAALAVSAILVTLYLGALALFGRMADRAAAPALAEARAAGEAVLSLTHVPAVAQPLGWSVIVETHSAIYRRDVRLGGEHGPTQRVERRLDDPRTRSALEAVPGFRSFARLPFARLEPQEHGTFVLLDDARYARGVEAGSWCSAEVLVDAEGGAHALE